MIENDESFPLDIKQSSKPVIVACSINLANCYIQTESWSLADTHAGKAIDEEPNNAKALFHRGVARLNNQQFDEAKEDLLKVLF